MNLHEQFMHRAIYLANKGLGSVSPNPLVGCVIVHEGKIIGEGWHQKFGDAHAEVNAINSVANKNLLSESTLYVTLEPCSHFGKTPPCADLILSHRIPRVVIANTDPNPIVSGRGIGRLREKGVEVVEGVASGAAAFMNRRFLSAMNNKRPYLILKWAETSDGFMARADGSSKWISGPLARKWVHKWRGEEQAIMAGVKTVITDDPELTVRDWSGQNPVRIIVDLEGQLTADYKVFNGAAPTLVYSAIDSNPNNGVERLLIERKDFLHQMLRDLFSKGIHSIFVEGGAALHQSLMNESLWDELRIFKGSEAFNDGICAPVRPQIFSGMEKPEICENELFVYFR
jgi:diaminohydroxyphosphoribosylaminopyrimidine deaminase/5-amino-6-(5-phosphoribosylamino)uracil reductase